MLHVDALLRSTLPLAVSINLTMIVKRTVRRHCKIKFYVEQANGVVKTCKAVFLRQVRFSLQEQKLV